MKQPLNAVAPASLTKRLFFIVLLKLTHQTLNSEKHEQDLKTVKRNYALAVSKEDKEICSEVKTGIESWDF